MSQIKISEGLFLEKQELDRWQKFIFQDGFIKHLLHNSLRFGLIRNSTLDPNFMWGRIETGTNAQTIKVNFTEALDKEGRVIIQPFRDNIAVPNDSNWYWVKLSYVASDAEVGLVSIDNQGNLTGVGTKFTEVLRGQPNFPAVVSFKDALNNILDYEVVQVIDDTNAILSGFFTAETNLQYRVVGTFTPGKVPTTAEKGVFQYDSASLQLVAETSLNTKPSSFVDGIDFALARVRIQGLQVIIQDKRTDIWQTLAFVESTFIPSDPNPLIGIEAIKFDASSTTRADNVLYAAWGMRSNNWTINTNLNTLTLQTSQGGKYKSAAQFNDGDFNGWRVYLPASGTYIRVVSSVKSGTQINLALETFDPNLFANTLQEVVVTPDAESIEFALIPNPSINSPEQLNLIYEFPIFESIGRMRANVFGPTASYNIQYRYKTNNRYSQYRALPSDPIGFYNEAAFDDMGDLIDASSLTPYVSNPVNSYITLTRHPNAYSVFARQVVTGDLFGIKKTALDNGDPVRYLVVGATEEHQVFESDITFTTDHFIDLGITDLKDGNCFLLQFKKTINANGFKLRITQGFVNAGNIGTVLMEFATEDFDNLNKYLAQGLLLECVFDLETTTWQVTPITDVEGTLLRPIVSYRSTAAQWFKVVDINLPNTIAQYEGAIVALEFGMVGGNNITHGSSTVSYAIAMTGATLPAALSNTSLGLNSTFYISSGPRAWSNVNTEDIFRAIIVKNNEVDGIKVEIWMRHNAALQNCIVTPIVLTHTVSSLLGGDKKAVVFTKMNSGVSALPTGILTQTPTHYLAAVQSQIDNIINVIAPKSKTKVGAFSFQNGGGNTGAGYVTSQTFIVPTINGAISSAYEMAISISLNYQRNRFDESFFIHRTEVLKNGVVQGSAHIYRQGQRGRHGGAYALACAFQCAPGDTILIRRQMQIYDDPFTFESSIGQGYYIITAPNG